MIIGLPKVYWMNKKKNHLIPVKKKEDQAPMPPSSGLLIIWWMIGYSYLTYNQSIYKLLKWWSDNFQETWMLRSIAIHLSQEKRDTILELNWLESNMLLKSFQKVFSK